MSAPPGQEAPERVFGFVLSDVARLMRKRFEQQARAEGLELTRAQWSVLARLARREGLRQTELAAILEVEPITLARQLDRLEAAGMVERRLDPSDRRARLLFLKPAAHPLLDQIRAVGLTIREEALAGLSPAERETFLALLVRVKGNLSDRLAADCAETVELAVHG
ncbi:MarR family winged helix-turn-helix transcriptional regulator [Marinivivus vitaminiproducens]|uniref:MarR family winged helix-turn-helix transcriptional regulator n=1 Tax=Marinivivus vitaminiproducens TaxID=3035935 RepID=UPI0027A3AC87|nr:MarR family transcriptional regulator [Geminicoccaceae bacterium SCSIO 64248]